MKNLYHKNKGKVHPSLDPTSPNSRDVLLSVLKLLPAAILALVSVLSVEDREVLAYLITRSIKTASPSSMIEEKKKCKRPVNGTTAHKPPIFDCGCFDCYTSYWYRWDSSPNRELIHQAIEAFEDHLTKGERSAKNNGNKGGRKRDHNKASRRVVSPNQAVVEKKSEEGMEDFVPALQDYEKKSGLVDESDSDGVPKTEHSEENRVSDVVVEEEEEKQDMGVTGNLAQTTGNPITPATGHRVPARKVVPDVFGLFNSRIWSLWNPSF